MAEQLKTMAVVFWVMGEIHATAVQATFEVCFVRIYASSTHLCDLVVLHATVLLRSLSAVVQ